MLLWAQRSSQHSVFLLQDPILPGISQLALPQKDINPPSMVPSHSGPRQASEKWGASWAREEALVRFAHSHSTGEHTCEGGSSLLNSRQTPPPAGPYTGPPSLCPGRSLCLKCPPHSVSSYPVFAKLLILPPQLTGCPWLCPVCWPCTQPWVHT